VRDQILRAICEIIQADVGKRGLRADPNRNLITETAGDFETACRSIADAAHPALAIVTGFYIPHARPPSGETDGPLGALFLARALSPLGIYVVLATDDFCAVALRAGLKACGLTSAVPVVVLPSALESRGQPPEGYWRAFMARHDPLPHLLTHLVALERAGPSHTPESMQAQKQTDSKLVRQFVRDVAAEHHDRCHTMRGRDITAMTSPAHLLFEACRRQTPVIGSIGIGDGGNEIGMGKIPWDVIRRNVPGGAQVACRVPTDQLIVSGVSNWGAYGLAAGVAILRGHALPRALFDIERERELLRIMVEQGPLVDGLSGQATISVDGLEFERYAAALRQIGQLTL
jgi:hypothetical protein